MVLKSMINLVISIWKYQEPEPNKCRKVRYNNILNFLTLPKTKLSFFHLFW